MHIALFLDVDDTLTRAPIQSYFAQHLNVNERYRELENGFQNESVTSKEFGDGLVALFASQGFTNDKALASFSQVQLNPWADRLLSLQDQDVHIFLVSNGPSYYIDELARLRSIPIARVCCSKYFFDAPGSVISSCDARSDQGKATFVQNNAARYDISIGIGDSPQHDGPFIAQCTFGFLTVQTDSYPYVPSFEHIIHLVERLKKKPVLAADGRRVLDAKGLTIPQLKSALSVGTWIAFFAVVAAAFTAGSILASFWPGK